MITIDRKAALSSTIVPAGWYVVEVMGLTTKPAKTDGSTNYNFGLQIVADRKGNTDHADVRCKDFLINEKGVFGNGVTFFCACDPDLIPLVEKVKKKELDNIPGINPEKCVGAKILAKIQTSEWEGRKSNSAEDFLPWDGKYL